MASKRGFRQYISSKLLELEPYSTKSFEHSIKLDAMEMPDDSSKLDGASMLSALSGLKLNRYPDPKFLILRKKILMTEKLDMSELDVIIGNGSDELIQLLCLLMSNDGKGKLLIPAPTFSVYKILGQIYGLSVSEFELDEDDFNLDISKFTERILIDQPSLIFIASPNNPTGNQLVNENIGDICRAANGLVILDEAYYSFSQSSRLDLLKNFENLLVMRTMSKIGFAGIRLGMLFGRKDVVTLLNKLRLPFNVNTVSQHVGVEILDCQKIVKNKIQLVVNERIFLMERLIQLKGIKVYPSEANFILVDFLNHNVELVFSRLLNAGILVKNVSNQHRLLKGCLRITVGTRDENRELLNILSKIIVKL